MNLLRRDGVSKVLLRDGSSELLLAYVIIYNHLLLRDGISNILKRDGSSLIRLRLITYSPAIYGDFNLSGDSLVEFVSTTSFIKLIESGEGLLSYSAEIHLRSL